MRFTRILLTAAAAAITAAAGVSQTIPPVPSSAIASNGGGFTSLPLLSDQTTTNAVVSSPVTSSSITSNTTSVTTTVSSTESSAPTTLPANFFNATDPAGPNALPYTPPLTPALVIAGLIFMITGGAYAFIGIKNRYQQIFISSAYLAALAVVVLVIYVMNPPVSNAVQGAYLVAATITGLAFGAVAVIFVEVSEGMGAMLGGFCLAMWILCLGNGGLIQNTAGKVIFIAALTIGMFSLSFSRHTRHYGLMVGTAFAGATIFILGIDCFSRAGLKELWLYIWNLNGKIFALNTRTFHHSRGMNVELAGIVLIFAFGIMSQIKLWRIIYRRRRRAEDARIDEEERAEAEERKANRRIERQTARDREQWERVHGNGQTEYDNDEQTDSGIGDDLSLSHKGEKSQSIVMSDLSSTHREGAPRVIQHPDALKLMQKAYLSPSASIRDSAKGSTPIRSFEQYADEKKRTSTITEPPVLVPLPHNPPAAEVEDNDDASSLATAATADRDGSISQRNSKRLSRTSQGSWRRKLSLKRSSRQPEADESPILVPHIEEDRASSIAATLDDVSDNDDIQTTYSPLNSPMVQTFADVPDVPHAGMSTRVVPVDDLKVVAGPTVTPERRAVESPTTEEQAPEPTEAAVQTTSKRTRPRPQSFASATGSVQSLSEQLAGDKVSKVLLSYRANEWAKHLEDADHPEFDQSEIAYPPDARPEREERPVPVNVAALTETATTSRPPTSNDYYARPSLDHQRAISVASLRQADMIPADLNTSREKTRGRSPGRRQAQPYQRHGAQRSTSAFSQRSGHSVRPSMDQTRPSMERRQPSIERTRNGSAMGMHSSMDRARSRSVDKLREAAQLQEAMYYSHLNNSSPQLLQGLMNKSTPNLINSARSISGGSQRGSFDESSSMYGGRPGQSKHAVSMHAQQAAITQMAMQMQAQQAYLAQQQAVSSAVMDRPHPFRSNTGSAIGNYPIPVAPAAFVMDPKLEREAKLASFRESLQAELHHNKLSNDHVDSRRVDLLQERERRMEALKVDEMSKTQRDSLFEERMRRGDMLDLHKEAMRRMQNEARRKSGL